ncbi:OLC1v1024758C1 [Oldenlandia corymbosa var. corymbosa]|uniref:OLC1v1024758C1 n=1 Tax=Oldenlandia corymbosa var. corymbosa TaxID=529605 RepID=A0AAV1C4V4_OLDCO|nr:OLC1v1024758C1 [Oldenlandia corymbosa var. corymbosa]
MEFSLLQDLPLEIIVAILMVLPIDALMCMMCVSKKFLSLISSSEFIKRHLLAALKEGNKFMLFDPNFVYNEPQKPFYLLSYENPINFSTIKRIPNVIDSDSYQIVSASGGLVFIIDTDSCGAIIHLWNPFIRRSLSLTTSTIGLEKFTFNDSRHLALGFGYVSQWDDHKIVRILYVEEEENGFLSSAAAQKKIANKENIIPFVEIFSLRSNTWEKIESSIFPWYLCDSISRDFVNNCVHWMASHVDGNSNNSEPVILSFDLLNEVFREIKLPAYYNFEESKMVEVTIYKGNLSLLFAHNPSLGKLQHCLLFVMEEYGNEASWTKEFDVVLDGFVHFPSLITANDEIAIIRTNVDDGKSELYLHNFCSNESRAFGDDQIEVPENVDFLPMIGSLVLLNAKNENMELLQGIDDDEKEKEALDSA